MADEETAQDEINRRFPTAGDLKRSPEAVINYRDYIAAQAASQEPPPPPPDKNGSYPRNSQENRPSLRDEPVPEDLKFHPPQVPSPDQYGIGREAQFRSSFEAFKNPIIALGLIGSLLTRRPLLSAMSFATGAMNGFHEGDMEQYNRNKEQFNEALKAAQEQNRIEIERYKAAWDMHSEMTDEKMVKLYAAASEFNNPALKAAVEAKNWPKAAQIMQDQEKIDGQIRVAQARMSANPRNYALQKYLEEHPNATAQEIQAFNQGGGVGRSALSTYVNRYIQEHPEATSDDIKNVVQKYQTQTTAINRFMSGTQGNTIRSLGVVVGHLKTLQELADDLRNGNIPKFNQVAQRVAIELGQPQPTNFDTAKQIVGAEIIKALGVAGAGSEGERAEAANNFMRTGSPEMISGSIDVAKRLLVSQIRGLKYQFIGAAGYGEAPEARERLASEFDQLLQPEAREFFGAIDVGSGKMVPTQKDIDWVKAHPEDTQKFIRHFGTGPDGG